MAFPFLAFFNTTSSSCMVISDAWCDLHLPLKSYRRLLSPYSLLYIGAILFSLPFLSSRAFVFLNQMQFCVFFLSICILLLISLCIIFALLILSNSSIHSPAGIFLMLQGASIYNFSTFVHQL